VKVGITLEPEGAISANGASGAKFHGGSDIQTPLADNSDRDPVGIDPGADDVPPTAAQRPDLIVDPGDLPATARELRDLLAASGRFFDPRCPSKDGPRSRWRPTRRDRIDAEQGCHGRP
jgi:hypothetical protein